MNLIREMPPLSLQSPDQLPLSFVGAGVCRYFLIVFSARSGCLQFRVWWWTLSHVNKGIDLWRQSMLSSVTYKSRPVKSDFGSSNSVCKVNTNKRGRVCPRTICLCHIAETSIWPFHFVRGKCWNWMVPNGGNRKQLASLQLSNFSNLGAFSVHRWRKVTDVLRLDLAWQWSSVSRLCAGSVTISNCVMRAAKTASSTRDEKKTLHFLTSRLISAQGHQYFWHFSGGINIEWMSLCCERGATHLGASTKITWIC